MTPQTRREFLGKLGWMAVGSLLVPYVPETFYSIPIPKIQPLDFLNHRALSIQEIARSFNISPMRIGELERAGFGRTFSHSIERQHDHIINCIQPWIARYEQIGGAKIQ